MTPIPQLTMINIIAWSVSYIYMLEHAPQSVTDSAELLYLQSVKVALFNQASLDSSQEQLLQDIDKITTTRHVQGKDMFTECVMPIIWLTWDDNVITDSVLLSFYESVASLSAEEQVVGTQHQRGHITDSVGGGKMYGMQHTIGEITEAWMPKTKTTRRRLSL